MTCQKLQTYAWLILSGVLMGCAGPARTPGPASPAPATPVQAPVSRPVAPEAVVYTVDADASEVTIRVLRGGALARFAHNHVMTVKSLSGQVRLHADPAQSSFDLSFPVAAMVVDETTARRSAGADFPGEIPADDRAGTRRNMLRAEVLDAEHFANITLRSVQVTPPLNAARVLARITIKGVTQEVSLPVMIESSSARVTASGQFDIKQSDFGIEPFTAALGAIKVVDQLQIHFKVVANRR